MSSPVVEHVFFTATDEYKKDPSGVFKRVAEILKETPGQVGSIFHALEEEDPNQGQLIVLWDKVESHQAFIASPRYAELLEAFNKAVTGEIKLVHVPYNADPTPALAAGITSVARFKLKDGKDKAEADAALAAVATLAPPEVLKGPFWGYEVEDATEVVMVSGWLSPEVHKAAREKEQDNEILQKVREFWDTKLAHAQLIKVD